MSWEVGWEGGVVRWEGGRGEMGRWEGREGW